MWRRVELENRGAGRTNTSITRSGGSPGLESQTRKRVEGRRVVDQARVVRHAGMRTGGGGLLLEKEGGSGEPLILS